MTPRVRAVAGFKRFTDPQLVTTGRGVVKEIGFHRRSPKSVSITISDILPKKNRAAKGG